MCSVWTACSSVCVCCSDSPDPAATPLPWPPSSLYVDRPLSWPHHPESPLSLRRRRRAAGQAAAARVRRPCRARKHGLCHEAQRYRNVRVQRNKRKCCIINEQSTGPGRSRASTRALGAQEPQGPTDDGQGCAPLSLTRMAAAGAPEPDYRPPATDPKVCFHFCPIRDFPHLATAPPCPPKSHAQFRPPSLRLALRAAARPCLGNR